MENFFFNMHLSFGIFATNSAVSGKSLAKITSLDKLINYRTSIQHGKLEIFVDKSGESRATSTYYDNDIKSSLIRSVSVIISKTNNVKWLMYLEGPNQNTDSNNAAR